MSIFKHELRRGTKSLLIWAASIGFMLVLCVLIYPDMKGEVDSMGDMFSSMGAFTAAFGMDRINFGSFMGFYAVECGNILGLGGAVFAALLGVSALAGEEREHTAEFLLSHPIKRSRVVLEKLLAVWAQVLLLNAAVLLLSVLSVLTIGEEPDWKPYLLLHLANILAQLELVCLCFGLSAFLSAGGPGLGVGISMGLYFVNIAANISEKAESLKYISPFAYAEGADILSESALSGAYLAAGAAFTALGVILAFIKYCRKDIRA